MSSNAQKFPLTIQIENGFLRVRAPDLDLELGELYQPASVGQIEMLVREMWNRKIPQTLHRMSASSHPAPEPKALKAKTPIKELLSTKEAASILGVSRDSLRRLAVRGLIPHSLSPGGHRKFTLQEIEKLSNSLHERPMREKSVL
jgi:excisionase family DNA binding protein